MLAFESEFTTLVQDLWTLNKSISHPAMRKDLGRLLTRSVPKYRPQRSVESEVALKNLQEKGCHFISDLSFRFSLDEVLSKLKDWKLHNTQTLNYQQRLVNRSEFMLAERPADVFLAGYGIDDLIRCTPLLRLACEQNFVATIEAYIGCTPTISGFQIWHTFPGYTNVPAESFHRDRDCFRFVKLFVYLSNVDANAGPHQYILGSHSLDTLQPYLQARSLGAEIPRFFEGNSRNLQSSELEKIFAENILTVTGAAGTGFLEDTYGLHRGTRPISSSRLIFSVTYTGLPLRYGNENDRTYEMSRKLSFSDVGLGNASDLERYMLRFYLH